MNCKCAFTVLIKLVILCSKASQRFVQIIEMWAAYLSVRAEEYFWSMGHSAYTVLTVNVMTTMLRWLIYEGREKGTEWLMFASDSVPVEVLFSHFQRMLEPCASVCWWFSIGMDKSYILISHISSEPKLEVL